MSVEPEGSQESDSMTIQRGSLGHGSRVGSLLIWAGARLMGDQRAALELAHK